MLCLLKNYKDFVSSKRDKRKNLNKNTRLASWFGFRSPRGERNHVYGDYDLLFVEIYDILYEHSLIFYLNWEIHLI